MLTVNPHCASQTVSLYFPEAARDFYNDHRMIHSLEPGPQNLIFGGNRFLNPENVFPILSNRYMRTVNCVLQRKPQTHSDPDVYTFAKNRNRFLTPKTWFSPRLERLLLPLPAAFPPLLKTAERNSFCAFMCGRCRPCVCCCSAFDTVLDTATGAGGAVLPFGSVARASRVVTVWNPHATSCDWVSTEYYMSTTEYEYPSTKTTECLSTKVLNVPPD